MLDRRRFLLQAAAATAGVTAIGACASEQADDGAASPVAKPSADKNVRNYGPYELRRGTAPSDSPNVVFIALDDCNDWMGFLNNHPGTRTPNIDALAATSLSFSKAYCTVPMCIPSRTGVMWGATPARTKVYDHSDASRAAYADFTKVTPSLVDDFWAAGYDTIGAGKVFNEAQKAKWTNYRNTVYYSEGVFRKKPDTKPETFDESWLSPYDGKPIGKGERFTQAMIDFGPSGRTTDDPDTAAATWVIDQLKADHPRPFFLGWGLLATHVPWRLPQKYLDLHPLEGIVLPELRPDDLNDVPAYARDKIVDQYGMFELLQQSGLWENAVQAYMAAITYMDDQVGRVLQALAESPHADNTIVVLWSDHGYHLGEKLHMMKFTLWERSTRVPFLVHAPGRFTNRQTFDEPVSLLDMGPTLGELTGVTINASHEGRSLLPVVASPELAAKRPPITTWLAGNYAVRSGPWRYIRYNTGDAELYDHRTDAEEYTNVADVAAMAPIRSELDAFLPPADPAVADQPSAGPDAAVSGADGSAG